MDIKNCQSLLKEITAIRKLYEKLEELNGDKFNIFNILGLTTNEVRTHSAFLGEILNPKGTHSFKDAFLKELLLKLEIRDFDSSSANVQVEKHVGFFNEEKTEGGYIDILITDKNNKSIIIENKVYAGDQENQLLRYFNYGKKYCKSFTLIYLTLDGKRASDFSVNTLSESDYICISYSDDIINWLTRCREIAVNQPVLRETFNQYIHLLKQLTDQTINTQMKDAIVNKIVSDEDNLRSFFEINNSDIEKEVRKNVIQRLIIQTKEIAENFEPKLEFEFEDDLGLDENAEMQFWPNPNDRDGYYFAIGFCEYYGKLIYGIFAEHQNYLEEHQRIAFAHLGKRLNGYHNWLWISEFEGNYVNWNSNPEPWLAVLDNNTMKNNIKEKISKMYEVYLEIKKLSKDT